jgi:hypothetical protein
VGESSAGRSWRPVAWAAREELHPARRLKFQSTIRSTKCDDLHHLRVLRQSPRNCKLLKNLVRLPCHGRGRGFESRRPRQLFSGSYSPGAFQIMGILGAHDRWRTAAHPRESCRDRDAPPRSLPAPGRRCARNCPNRRSANTHRSTDLRLRSGHTRRVPVVTTIRS